MSPVHLNKVVKKKALKTRRCSSPPCALCPDAKCSGNVPVGSDNLPLRSSYSYTFVKGQLQCKRLENVWEVFLSFHTIRNTSRGWWRCYHKVSSWNIISTPLWSVSLIIRPERTKETDYYKLSLRFYHIFSFHFLSVLLIPLVLLLFFTFTAVFATWIMFFGWAVLLI